MNGPPPPRWFVVAFLAPAFALFTTFVAWPAAQALAFSLYDWNGLSDAEWAGLNNFFALVADGDLFMAALWHNLFLTIVPGASILALSLTFASLLHRRVRGANLFRVAFFFPNVMAAVAVALLWILIYSTTDFGLLNALLGAVQSGLHGLGLDWPNWDLPIPFSASKHLLYALVPMLVWTATGFYMVLFLAAMGGIPESYYEAAKLDGATPWQQFRFITLPLIRDVLTVGVVFLLITSLKLFDPIWVMENQRPTKDSHVLATLVYQKVFTEYDVGYGAAVAVMLFVLVFAASLVALRWGRAERLEY